MDNDNRNDSEKLFKIDTSKIPRPQISGKMIAGVIGVILVVVLARATFYQVETEEVGVVLRFGEFIKTTDPGLRMKIPFVDTMIPVPVTRQLSQQFGFRAGTTGVFEDESLMLTGDLNVAVVEWTTQFRVKDPYNYLFKLRNLRETFRHMNEAVMRGVVGDRSVTEVLTIGRQEIASEVEVRLQALCDQ